MKALSVKQPYANLLLGPKDVENRTWYTPFRGRIHIHASSQLDRPAYIRLRQDFGVNLEFMALGAIIGEMDIVACVRDSASVWAEPGMWHWVRAHPILYPEPIPCKGRLGLFVPDIPLEAQP